MRADRRVGEKLCWQCIAPRYNFMIVNCPRSLSIRSIRMRMAAVVAIAAICAGCGGDGMTGSSTVTGAYTLRTVNGAPLPYTQSSSGTTKTEILDNTISLHQGGTYSEEAHTRTTSGTQVTTQTITEAGSYSFFGNSITLQSGSSSHSRLLTVEGNTMTHVEAGVAFVYRK